MNATNELIEAAMSLSVNDRSYIADKLIESLDEESISPEWQQELERRLARYADGTAVTYSSQQARQAAQEAIEATS